MVDLGGGTRPGRPLLVLGPSLGTTAHSLWGAAATRLAEDFRVVAWDLPGHGAGEPATDFDLAGLARAVLTAVAGWADGPFHYAGDSIGGAVGLRILLDAPDLITSATLLCTGARIGEPGAWRDRAAAVRAGGTEVLLADAPGRWFGPGFAEREARTAETLLRDLRDTDAASYAAACEALAAFDVRDRLHEIAAPVLAVAGDADIVTTTAVLRHLADGVRHGRLVVLPGVAHLAPAERPELVAELVAGNAAVSSTAETTAQVRAVGMRVRREVLGDAHVDRASAGATEFTADFQQLITQYAWGGIWARPGLDRRSRSIITLTALVARGHHEELAMHLRAARRNGLSNDEIKELLLQTAIYCGVPDANAAFRVAQQVLAEFADQDLGAEKPLPTNEEEESSSG
ncbi:4-carboxymuconolactone decarboxylase [Solihabitans fulvus]|uniref:4-carboxymuconolactone decarboxylase n=1 Tax=Solihabitans fulvus TaxID=1892852 RepID=A0A5B2XIJ6_9PSEU|nr:4-carboxymuconolactone decarboxylase [Solihabitans fulvus]